MPFKTMDSRDKFNICETQGFLNSFHLRTVFLFQVIPIKLSQIKWNILGEKNSNKRILSVLPI